MIVTLTLNPSVDRTVEVERLARGEVTRAIGVRVEPGGKGINVSRALATHGLSTRAVITVGGPEGEHLITLLRNTGIEIVPVRIGRAIRSNIAVVEPDGTTTKLNEPGGQLSASELEAVFGAVKQPSRGPIGSSSAAASRRGCRRTSTRTSSAPCAGRGRASPSTRAGRP